MSRALQSIQLGRGGQAKLADVGLVSSQQAVNKELKGAVSPWAGEALGGQTPLCSVPGGSAGVGCGCGW